MASLVESAGWVTNSGNGPYASEVEALIADLMEWAESEAVKYRAEGWAAHNRKESIKEATYIGREWAFMSMQFRIRELLDTLKEGLVNSQEGPIASGLPPTRNTSVDERSALIARCEELEGALMRIATPKRPDGTYNLSREACEQIAKEALRRADT